MGGKISLTPAAAGRLAGTADLDHVPSSLCGRKPAQVVMGERAADTRIKSAHDEDEMGRGKILRALQLAGIFCGNVAVGALSSLRILAPQLGAPCLTRI